MDERDEDHGLINELFTASPLIEWGEAAPTIDPEDDEDLDYLASIPAGYAPPLRWITCRQCRTVFGVRSDTTKDLCPPCGAAYDRYLEWEEEAPRLLPTEDDEPASGDWLDDPDKYVIWGQP